MPTCECRPRISSTMFVIRLAVVFCAAVVLSKPASAQVNSGSDGSDGDLNPTTSITIDMADHPDGIYQYRSVNIPTSLTVSFTPNAANTPVVWLVQQSCTVSGSVYLYGSSTGSVAGGRGGPGGYRGGTGFQSGVDPGAGLGPGGGRVTSATNLYGGNASNATSGSSGTDRYPPGATYGDPSLLVLVGGSGGGGSSRIAYGGGGGGGAILIAASGTITIGGNIYAYGGAGGCGNCTYGGSGSGGAIRLVASTLVGSGYLSAHSLVGVGGLGRIRLEAVNYSYFGVASGVVTTTQTPGIVLLPNDQMPRIHVSSVGGAPVTTSAGGSPHVLIPGNQLNPMPVSVLCEHIRLGSDVTIHVKPDNGADSSYTGMNNAGTYASSVATILVSIPNRTGTIQAKTTSDLLAFAPPGDEGSDVRKRTRFARGWTADGESFKSVEVTAALGGEPQLVLITDSGKRFPIPRETLRAMK